MKIIIVCNLNISDFHYNIISIIVTNKVIQATGLRLNIQTVCHRTLATASGYFFVIKGGEMLSS